MKPLFAAIGFLTVFPVPSSLMGNDRHLARSLWAFPIVGAALGFFIAALDIALCRLFPAYIASIFDGVALLLLTGGLHLDGLADTADGFFSSRSREQVLQIMKSGNSGPMGVASVVCVLLLKTAVLAAVSPHQRFSVLVLTPLAGRCAMVWMMRTLRYARPHGTGAIFSKKPSWFAVSLSLSFLVAIGYLLGLGVTSAVIWVACLVTFGGGAWWSHKMIGGWTGDTLGATSEIEELIPSLVAIAYNAL